MKPQQRVFGALSFLSQTTSGLPVDASSSEGGSEPQGLVVEVLAPGDSPPPVLGATIRRWEPFAVFFVTLGVLVALVPHMTNALNPLTGDEPFYLMTAISILQDGDLNECNNYRERDESQLYPAFYAGTNIPLGIRPKVPANWDGWPISPYPLPPHPANLFPASRECLSTDPAITLPSDGTHSELYSKHGLGLTLLVLPAFALLGRIGVVLFLTILGALLAANVYLLARESTGKVLPSVLTWIAFAVASPFFAYSFLIFPELPAGLLVLYAFRRIRLWNNNPWQIAAVGLCLAFLPWLHYRFLPLTLALFIYFIYQDVSHKTGPRRLNYGVVLGLLVVSGALLMLFFYLRYGQIYPDLNDHAGLNDAAGTLCGAAGLLIDEQWGLLVYAPIFILTFVGLILMALKAEWRKQLLWIGVIAVPYYLLIANYAQWWGEWCPPARYLVSILPLFAVPFSLSLDWIRSRAYKAIYGLVLVPTLVVTIAFAYQPQWMYSQPRPYCGSTLFDQGMPQLLPSLFGEFKPEVLNCASTTTTYRGDGPLPTFVAPYFMYTYDKTGYFGPLFAAAAWKASIGPFAVIALIILVSLLLFWWQRRREGDPLDIKDASAPNVANTMKPMEEVPNT